MPSFFVNIQGSNATGDCCSKCWRSIQKQQGQTSQDHVANTTTTAPSESSSPMETDGSKLDSVVEDIACDPMSYQESFAEESLEKKSPNKKSKASYKAMMASITQGTKSSSDIEKEKESLRNVTGGGSFKKIDRI
jgi:hypothetical protein